MWSQKRGTKGDELHLSASMRGAALLAAICAITLSASTLTAATSSYACATGGYPFVCSTATDHQQCQMWCDTWEPFSQGWCYTEPQTSPPNFCCQCLP